MRWRGSSPRVSPSWPSWKVDEWDSSITVEGYRAAEDENMNPSLQLGLLGLFRNARHCGPGGP